MKQINIVNNYFGKHIKYIKRDYCPSYFNLQDLDGCDFCDNIKDCTECWDQESEVNTNEILSVLWKLYNINNEKIKKLRKKEKELLDNIQEVCTHENVSEEFIDPYDNDEEIVYRKCKDCGKILI